MYKASSVRRILKRGGRNFRKFERSESQISLISRPKLGEERKKRSSLKFGPIFCPKLGEEQKKRSSLKFGLIFSQTRVQA